MIIFHFHLHPQFKYELFHINFISMLLLFDKADDVPPAATDGNQEGEQSAETLKENIRLIEVCSVLSVYYASPAHGGDVVLIAKDEVHLSQKDQWVNLDTALFMTPLMSYKLVSNLLVVLGTRN